MPVYAYACKDCGHAFDIRQSFSEDPLTVCPECDGGLRKKFNTVGVVFKGSGFYRNDSRTSGGSGAGAPAGGSGEGAPAGGSTGTSAPATPAAPAPAAVGAAPSGSTGSDS
jgi:putative FmdB family regulatory protein